MVVEPTGGQGVSLRCRQKLQCAQQEKRGEGGVEKERKRRQRGQRDLLPGA